MVRWWDEQGSVERESAAGEAPLEGSGRDPGAVRQRKDREDRGAFHHGGAFKERCLPGCSAARLQNGFRRRPDRGAFQEHREDHGAFKERCQPGCSAARLQNGCKRRPPICNVLAIAVALSLAPPPGRAQQMCPKPSQRVCGRCPNECLQCTPEDHNIKCPGASWGNTNSTFMNISCAPPPGLPPEAFPKIPILKPELSSPIVCSGTVQKGLWPFDADNMTFTVETMFRDPEQEQQVNSIHLHCVKLALTIESSGASDLAGTEEALACPITTAQRDVHDYSGLELYVCQGINARDDPYCSKGRWVPIITGACIGETVTGTVELTDLGSRLLIRVGIHSQKISL